MNSDRTIASLVGALVDGIGFDEPDTYELLLRPASVGATRSTSEAVIVRFTGVRNGDRVKRFSFGRRPAKPVGEFLDQLVAVERRSRGWALRFLRAGQVIVESDEPTCMVKE